MNALGSFKKAIGLSLLGLGLLWLLFSGSASGGLLTGIAWGVGLGTVGIAAFFVWFLIARLRDRETGTTEAVGSPPDGGAFLDAITHPITWMLWGALLGLVWLYSSTLLTTPNATWIPLGLWMLFLLFFMAKSISKEKCPGKAKEKKPSPTIATAATVTQRFAFLATVAVIAYYAVVAPTGTWTKVAGKGAKVPGPTGEMIVPEGIPLNPNFTSAKLANWSVTYVAANPQYRVPQAGWHAKKVILKEEPGREVAEVVNLTVSFDEKHEGLDIHLNGACKAIADTRRPQISKTCAGWWKDRGGQISGQFYLEVTEASNRYFDAYLYDGNFLPKKSELAMMLGGPPIPAIVLQFRPNNWSEDKN